MLSPSIDDNIELPFAAEILFQNDKKLVFNHWNWDYSEYLEFNQRATAYIAARPEFRIEIFCNHPHLLTMGRGNQRGVDTLPSGSQHLSLPLHHIYRGGGLTFHGPFQWIHYSLTRLNSSNNNLSQHLHFLLEHTCDVIELSGIKRPTALRSPLGLWQEGRKIASLGVGIRQWVTNHGIALNLGDDMIFAELNKVNPCGLSGEVYSSLEKIHGIRPTLQDFSQLALVALQAYSD